MKIRLSRYGFHNRMPFGIHWAPYYFGGKLKMLSVYVRRSHFILSFDFRKGDLADWLKVR